MRIPKPKINKACRVCKYTFLTSRNLQKFCSSKCRRLRYSTYYLSTPLKVSVGTVGAITELIASVDLMKKGYEVYRALSPASSCDLLALKNNKLYTFEVRTGQYNSKFKISYNKHNIRAKNVVVITLGNNKIHYIPELPNEATEK